MSDGLRVVLAPVAGSGFGEALSAVDGVIEVATPQLDEMGAALSGLEVAHRSALSDSGGRFARRIASHGLARVCLRRFHYQPDSALLRDSNAGRGDEFATIDFDGFTKRGQDSTGDAARVLRGGYAAE